MTSLKTNFVRTTVVEVPEDIVRAAIAHYVNTVLVEELTRMSIPDDVSLQSEDNVSAVVTISEEL